MDLVRARVDGLVALYAFGSVARGDDNHASDIDLALLAARPLANSERFALQQELEVKLHRDVDLVDLKHASTVMRVRVLADARVLLDLDPYARQLFEATALSAYARLNVERKGIIDDIRRRGHVYG